MLLLLGGCSAVPVPQDPDGTLERVRATHELRVGASPSEGLVEVEGDEKSRQPDLRWTTNTRS